ncbi:hypothetical protein [Synechococcus sp. PCC 7502]|uniref:hypothetical protein n=1 Tax=Synechococcus sp. PCC 7502 TaxID=1173263 RepID=UPI001AEFD7CC|nr:hypothetical protein [Synechococcus sp. PCC 7502]
MNSSNAKNIAALSIISKSPCSPTEIDKRHYGLNESTHQYSAERAAEVLNRDLKELRLITCNLDKGCSLAAVHNGEVIDTATGFTPLEGLMIDYSSGSIDTSVLYQMMREENGTDATSATVKLEVELETGNQSSVVSTSKVLEDADAMDTDNSRAKQALDIYVHRLRSCLGSMLMILGGMDALVFTAELGENSEIVRELVCHSLKFLGLELDLAENQNDPVDLDIATKKSKVRVLVIHTKKT